MLGLNNYVVVIVINALVNKPTNFFDGATTISVAAFNSVKAGTTGNYHAKSDIQKQAYDANQVKNVRTAFGITGTNFGTHTPYINGKQVSLEQDIVPRTEIVLIENSIAVDAALQSVTRHSILPSRTNPNLY